MFAKSAFDFNVPSIGVPLIDKDEVRNLRANQSIVIGCPIKAKPVA